MKRLKMVNSINNNLFFFLIKTKKKNKVQKLYCIKQLNIISFSFVPLTYSKMQRHQLTTPTDRRHLLTLVISSAFHLPQSNVRIFNVAQGQLCLQAPHTYVCANARTLENSKCRCDDEAHALIDTPIWFGDILCMVFFYFVLLE